MTIAFAEFARRVCVANHSIHHADKGQHPVPCASHILVATSAWGLCGEAGAKTLAVVNQVADESGLIAAASRDPHTQAVGGVYPDGTTNHPGIDFYDGPGSPVAKALADG